MVACVLLVIICLFQSCAYEVSSSTSFSRVVSVCPGEQLNLTCIANHSSVLTWKIILPEENITESRSVPFMGTPQSSPFSVFGARFNFKRLSTAQTLPLRSELLIDGINTNLSGTDIHCSPLNVTDPQTTFALHVLGENTIFYPPKVEKDEYVFEGTNFTVILNWTEEDSVLYNVSTDPLAELTPLASNVLKVVGNYNTLYNVSIEATLCNMYSKTTSIVFEYATCESLTETQIGISDPRLRVIGGGSRFPAIVGDSVTLYCASGELMGPNKITCLENGDWEPDPSDIMCNQVSSRRCGPPLSPINGYVLTTTNASVTFVCQNETQLLLETATCNQYGVWEPDPRDHCTVADSDHKGKLSGALIGSVLGSMFVAAVVVVAALAIMILLKKGFKKLRRRLPEQNIYNESLDENQNHGEAVLYADIGPSSFTNRPQISEITLGLDDHVEYAQLNQHLLTVKLDQIMVASCTDADDTLNLDTLLIQVKGAVTSRWYELGVALEISKEVLDRYCSRPPEESIIEMLDQWLRSGPVKRTWRDVANALRKISLQRLANDIEKVYETGKLPIEVDMNDIPKEPILPKTTEFPPPLLSKMKANSSDSHLPCPHQRTLLTKNKQNSDSRLINYQREHHHHTVCTRDTLPLELELAEVVQETTIHTLTLDSESLPPPLPPKPTAMSDSSNHGML